MPRRARLMLPSVPLHIIQRGNNRQACFFADEDYRFYLDWLAEYAKKHGCSIHAYVLMTNHVHLLLSAEHTDAAGALMKALGQRYVQYVNRTYRRSGTLWEGRFKSCLTQEETYLLGCQRYIELNPVRADMARINRGQTTVSSQTRSAKQNKVRDHAAQSPPVVVECSLARPSATAIFIM